MKYTVHFSSGNTLIIDEARYRQIFENKGVAIERFLYDNFLYINIANIDYIMPIKESTSGVAATPTPDDLKDRNRQREEALKADPNSVLKRAIEKHENE